MTTRRAPLPRGLGRGLALAVLLTWALHAWAMAQEYSLAIMCWSCHVATLAVAAGLWRGYGLLVAAGTLFHLGAGLPSWLVESLVSGRWFPTSVVVHLFPPAAGLLNLKQAGELPRRAVLAAWAIHVGMVPVSRWATAPEWNVNLSHEPWQPVASFFSSLFAFHAAAALVTWMALGTAGWVVGAWLARRAHSGA